MITENGISGPLIDSEKLRLLAISKQEFAKRRKIVIINLPDAVDLEDLKLNFLHGYVVTEICIDRNSANVLLGTPEQADKAINTLNNQIFHDCTVGISFAPPDSLLFVGNLPFDFTEEQFRELMSPFGCIERLFLVRSEITGDSKGYGFVEYTDRESATQSKQHLMNTGSKYVGGRILRVDFAEPNLHTYDDLHSRTLFVDRLPRDFTNADVLRQLFGRTGAITFAQVAVNPQTGSSRGFAFVDHASAEEAERGQRTHNGVQMEGSNIRVAYGTPGRTGASILGNQQNNYQGPVQTPAAAPGSLNIRGSLPWPAPVLGGLVGPQPLMGTRPFMSPDTGAMGPSGTRLPVPLMRPGLPMLPMVPMVGGPRMFHRAMLRGPPVVMGGMGLMGPRPLMGGPLHRGPRPLMGDHAFRGLGPRDMISHFGQARSMFSRIVSPRPLMGHPENGQEVQQGQIPVPEVQQPIPDPVIKQEQVPTLSMQQPEMQPIPQGQPPVQQPPPPLMQPQPQQLLQQPLQSLLQPQQQQQAPPHHLIPQPLMPGLSGNQPTVMGLPQHLLVAQPVGAPGQQIVGPGSAPGQPTAGQGSLLPIHGPPLLGQGQQIDGQGLQVPGQPIPGQGQSVSGPVHVQPLLGQPIPGQSAAGQPMNQYAGQTVPQGQYGIPQPVPVQASQVQQQAPYPAQSTVACMPLVPLPDNPAPLMTLPTASVWSGQQIQTPGAGVAGQPTQVQSGQPVPGQFGVPPQPLAPQPLIPQPDQMVQYQPAASQGIVLSAGDVPGQAIAPVQDPNVQYQQYGIQQQAMAEQGPVVVEQPGNAAVGHPPPAQEVPLGLQQLPRPLMQAQPLMQPQPLMQAQPIQQMQGYFVQPDTSQQQNPQEYQQQSTIGNTTRQYLWQQATAAVPQMTGGTVVVPGQGNAWQIMAGQPEQQVAVPGAQWQQSAQVMIQPASQPLQPQPSGYGQLQYQQPQQLQFLAQPQQPQSDPNNFYQQQQQALMQNQGITDPAVSSPYTSPYPPASTVMYSQPQVSAPSLTASPSPIPQHSAAPVMYNTQNLPDNTGQKRPHDQPIEQPVPYLGQGQPMQGLESFYDANKRPRY